MLLDKGEQYLAVEGPCRCKCFLYFEINFLVMMKKSVIVKGVCIVVGYIAVFVVVLW